MMKGNLIDQNRFACPIRAEEEVGSTLEQAAAQDRIEPRYAGRESGRGKELIIWLHELQTPVERQVRYVAHPPGS